MGSRPLSGHGPADQVAAVGSPMADDRQISSEDQRSVKLRVRSPPTGTHQCHRVTPDRRRNHAHSQVDEKLIERPPRYWARVSREPAMLGIRNGRQPQLDNTDSRIVNLVWTVRCSARGQGWGDPTPRVRERSLEAGNRTDVYSGRPPAEGSRAPRYRTSRADPAAPLLRRCGCVPDADGNSRGPRLLPGPHSPQHARRGTPPWKTFLKLFGLHLLPPRGHQLRERHATRLVALGTRIVLAYQYPDGSRVIQHRTLTFVLVSPGRPHSARSVPSRNSARRLVDGHHLLSPLALFKFLI